MGAMRKAVRDMTWDELKELVGEDPDYTFAYYCLLGMKEKLRREWVFPCEFEKHNDVDYVIRSFKDFYLCRGSWEDLFEIRNDAYFEVEKHHGKELAKRIDYEKVDQIFPEIFDE